MKYLRAFEKPINGIKAFSRGGRVITMRVADDIGILEKRPPVGIIIEKANWAIRWYGTFISDAANSVRPGTSWITTDPARITSGIIEFGSQYQWVEWSPLVNSKCKTVSTFLHGKPEDGEEVARHIDSFLAAIPRLDKIICSASLVRDRLLNWGVPNQKLVLIPIGCETMRFTPPTLEQRRVIRAQLGFPDDAIVVGSFQKDGEGWGDGSVPKLIKGPDIFLAVIDRLRRIHNIHVMLTGPARGYLKAGLERIGVPYVHRFASDRDELAKFYHSLDLYLVTSREEGGPMGLMESMASFVPVVSTHVGMAPDLINNGVTGFIVNELDPDLIAIKATETLTLSDNAYELKFNARERVKDVDWSVIGRRHLEEVWLPLVDKLG